MVSSPVVYDLVVEHAAADRPAADEFASVLRGNGMRLWLPGRSAPGGGADVDSAVAGSRAAIHLIGTAGTTPESLPARPLIVLAPGSPAAPRDVVRSVPDGVVVDFRDGFDSARPWSQLRAAMPDPSGPSLNHYRLKTRTMVSYDHIAEKFADRWFDHPPSRPLELFAGHLARSGHVLDAGCGPGHHARWLAERGHDVMGVDLSAGMLRIARSRVPTAAFRRMDLQSLRFPPGIFDGIWCAGAAMHIPREEIVTVLRGFRRLLRPGGVIGLNMQVGRRSELVEYENDRRFFEYYRDSGELAVLAARAGLDVVAADLGVTTRNTHGLDLVLTWATLITVRAIPRPAGRPVRYEDPVESTR
jgi:SAM-dependent methyltransferase